MRDWLPNQGASRWVEPLGALAVLIGGVVAIGCLLINNYLPQPFFYQPFDTWMDWFNTAHWAHHFGRYDSWGTLYPPISFVFLKPLTLSYCYVDNEGWYSRDCDWWGAITMHALFVLNVYLTGMTFLKIDRRTALCRSFVVVAGMPMLDGLERGNLIMICYTCYLLGHGPLLRSARLKMVFAGMAINFKIYLVGTLFAYAIRRRWRWFEGAVFATLGVYLVTWGMIGEGTPGEIVTNLVRWSEITSSPLSVFDLWYASTYIAVTSLLTSLTVPITELVGSDIVAAAAVVFPGLTLVTQVVIVVAVAFAWLRPEVVPTFRLVNLIGTLAMVTSEAGGYVGAMIILLTFFEPWRAGVGVRIAIVTGYILSIPGDIYINRVTTLLLNGFLNTGPTFYTYWVTVGPFLRPGMLLIMGLGLSATTIADVWSDVRAQGAAGRWRFRRDLPILLLGGGTRIGRVVAA